MRRYGNIFLLHFQIVLTERGRSFVWFLMSLVPPLAVYLYWRAAFASHNTIPGWNLSSISSYYFLLIVASSALVAHIEEDVSYEDIQQGELTGYILKPFSYITMKLFLETPYRILQGGFALIPVVLFLLFFGKFFTISDDPWVITLACLIAILGYSLSFLFKMIIGICTFWLTDASGFFQLVEGIMFIFAGFLLPITLLPGILAKIAAVLPFSYMVYYPIVAFQGGKSYTALFAIIATQLIWIGLFFVFYSWLWNKGIKKFTGVGN